ncbi:unnamed protein product [Echinostoma caproni]|uniref:FBA_3 domain-containing protein n=1 Tax=Echinostoma caproni TaxID=27848 RepID=A0A183BFH4_9TREM|nr:unnamed protein product [Echinostoma caproni]
MAVCPMNTGEETHPYFAQHITVLFGSLHVVHHVRLNFKVLNSNAFTAGIEITMDGQAFTSMENATFYRQNDQTYIFALLGAIAVRGLRMVFRKSVVLRKTTPHSIQVFGLSTGRDIHQFDPCKPYNTLKDRGVPMLPNDMVLFNRSYLYVDDKLIICYLWELSDQWSKYAMKCVYGLDKPNLSFTLLGPMVSQVIAYQPEAKLYFGIGPELLSIVMSTDLERPWIGINLYGYQINGLNKGVIKAEYLLWEETAEFNSKLTGLNCTKYTAENWHWESITEFSSYVTVYQNIV